MLDYKLIKLVQVLTPKELTELERYAEAPFVNTNADVPKLFAQLCKYYPAFDHPKLSKERLYAKLYGKGTYNDGKMRKLMTQLTQLIEQFLVAKELDAAEDVKAKLLARSLAGRQSYDLFYDVVDARLKELEKGTERGRDYFREGFELSEMLYFHPGSGKLNKRNELYDKGLTDFEHYFTLVLLQNEANNVVRTRLIREKGIRTYLDTAMSVAESESFASSQAIRFFHHIILLLRGRSEENLDGLRESSFEAFKLLNRFERDLAINLLRNYAVPMVNKGSVPHRKFTLDLYKMELEEGVLSNTIGPTAFMNIATIGLSLGELDWVTQFLSHYGDYVPENEREITLCYCKGLWYYTKGLSSSEMDDFYEALKWLNFIPIRTGPNYEIRVRPVMLRIHFELFIKGKEAIEDILSQVRNFERHLMGSNEYAVPIRESYIIFSKYYKSLIRLINSHGLKSSILLDFLEKLNNEKSDVAIKSWLQKRVEELAKIG